MQRIVEEARRVLEQERNQTKEKFDAAVGEVNQQCNEILQAERQQLQAREANTRRYLETGEMEKKQFKDQMEELQQKQKRINWQRYNNNLLRLNNKSSNQIPN
jgi:hypothetical protein